MQAPIGGLSDAKLATAVCNAGALGAFQALHPTGDTDWFTRELDGLRAGTTQPFAVGFITAFLPFVPERFDIALERGVPVIAFSFGDPSPYIERAHASGAKVICQVQTLAHARVAVDAGADAIAAQGTEAGGHTGTMGLLPLLGSVLDAFPDVPVLAAGGVGNGRTLAGVLAMGADGAWMGSAFLATREATVDERWKELIVGSDGTDTVWTQTFDIVSGRPWPEGIGARVHANKFTQRWNGRVDDLRARAGEVKFSEEFDPDESAVYYGQSAALVHGVRPVAQVVSDIVGDAERYLTRAASDRDRPAG